MYKSCCVECEIKMNHPVFNFIRVIFDKALKIVVDNNMQKKWRECVRKKTQVSLGLVV